MRDGDPAQYWYARTILVSNDEGVVRYVLLAASSPSITGNGHFFELRLAVALLLSGLGLSFLWWWPFVRHLSRPLLKWFTMPNGWRWTISSASTKR